MLTRLRPAFCKNFLWLGSGSEAFRSSGTQIYPVFLLGKFWESIVLMGKSMQGQWLNRLDGTHCSKRCLPTSASTALRGSSNRYMSASWYTALKQQSTLIQHLSWNYILHKILSCTITSLKKNLKMFLNLKKLLWASFSVKSRIVLWE